MNPNSYDTTVHKNQLVGYTDEIGAELGTLLDHKNEGSIDNFTPACRTTLQEHSPVT